MRKKFQNLFPLASKPRSFTTCRCWKTTLIVSFIVRRFDSNYRFVRAMSTTGSCDHQKQRIAVAQLCSTSSKFDNLVNVAKSAGWAIHRESNLHEKCRMLFLPECFGFIGSSAEQTLAAAEPDWDINTQPPRGINPTDVTDALIQTVQTCATTGMQHPTQLKNSNDHSDVFILSDEEDRTLSLLDGLRTIAKASQLWISAGGVHIRDDQSMKVYNTHVIVDDLGEFRCRYRKRHLFDVCIPGKVDLRESKIAKAGSDLVVCRDSPLGCLGVTICYDLRFPEMYIQLTQEMGADVLLVPSAFTVPTGQAHWHILLRGKCIILLKCRNHKLRNDRTQTVLLFSVCLFVQPALLKINALSLPQRNAANTTKNANHTATLL